MLAQILAFVHGPTMTLVLGGLLALSEYLGSTTQFAANGVIQAVINALKWVVGSKSA